MTHRSYRRRTQVMGVLNITPDSFSDGGKYADTDAAIAAGLRLLSDGADIIDVGGESTRPGAERVSVVEELDRVLPVISGLVAHGAVVSIDTMRAEVAVAAVAVGAKFINDVSGGLADPEMLTAIAPLGVPYVVMHWRAHGRDMDYHADYSDVVAEVISELRERLHACDSAGIDRGRVIVDPGLGFAKRSEHNWALLQAMDRLHRLGSPVLVGASRKRFLGELLVSPTDGPRDIAGREAATTAITALAAAAGAWGVRVHNVKDSADAVRAAAAWQRGRA